MSDNEITLGLFAVKRKGDNKNVNVYDVKRDNKGYPLFLIYEDNQWLYKSAKLFYPLSERMVSDD